MVAEPKRSAFLGEIGRQIRQASSREELTALVTREVREALGANRCSMFARDPGDPKVARLLGVSDDGRLAPFPQSFPVEGTYIDRALRGEVVSIEAVEGDSPDARMMRARGIGAALLVPFRDDGEIEAGITVVYDRPRRFEDLDLVMLRAIALQVESALSRDRLVVTEIERRHRSDSLQRTVLALRDAREVHDVLAIVARGLSRDFRRPCTAYELRDGNFRPVAGSEITSVKVPIPGSEFDLDTLRVRTVWRHDGADLLALSSDGQMRALFRLEEAREPLSDEDSKYLRSIGAHAALALTSALAFDQLRRYAAEGAALTDAAATILEFTQLEPLAQALCRIGTRLVFADRACIYARRGDRLVLIGHEAQRKELAAPGTLPGGDREAREVLAAAFGSAPLAATSLILPAHGERDEGRGLLVVTRPAGYPFERAELRLLDALVTLAALALRNVDFYEQSTLANRALAESNSFKDDLMAMFAHDFRGPLTVIYGYCELLLESGDEEVCKSVATIVEQTKRLGKLSEDALALAATQSAGFSLQRAPGDFTEFIRETVEPLARGSGRVRVEAPAEPIVLAFDRSRLRHAIENVVGNALKYSSEPVDLRISMVGAEVRLDVADRGIGIRPDELERVFVRFGRGSNARSRGFTGSGVGLYIAKKIVEVHGGHLTVASRENEGSTFTIALPAGP